MIDFAARKAILKLDVAISNIVLVIGQKNYDERLDRIIKMLGEVHSLLKEGLE